MPSFSYLLLLFLTAIWCQYIISNTLWTILMKLNRYVEYVKEGIIVLKTIMAIPTFLLIQSFVFVYVSLDYLSAPLLTHTKENLMTMASHLTGS